ncbi:MAG: hypothetical protein KAI95_18000 [Bacteroidales bacterium]|nr:hypothetical protein [Bacteroidales bacterium]
MKKTHILTIKILLFFVPVLIVSDLKAQSNWEIGARFGDNFSIDMTIPI